MRNVFKVFGIIALVAVIGFFFAACDSGGGGGGNDTWGNPPAALVGTWMTQGVSPVLTINANGTGNLEDTGSVDWKVKGSELKMTYSGVESIVKWSVSGSGSTLTFSVPSDSMNMGSMANMLIAFSPLTKKSGNGGNGGDVDANHTVTLKSVEPDGSSTWTTTKLVLSFNTEIDGLSAADITLSGVNGVSKGTLSDSNPYTLPISGFTSSGSLNVAVSKSGYTINGSPKTVSIYYSSGSNNNNNITLNSVTPNGSSTETTTQLTLLFDREIPGLTAGDITLSGVSVSKGTLSGSNPYTLPISGFTSSGSLNVAVSKSGYTINGSPKTVGIFYYSSGSGNTTAVSGVTLNQNTLTLTVGSLATLTATVTPSTATNRAVSWTTSNGAVASVSNGTVTAVAVGSATITVSTVDGNFTATCFVTVAGSGNNSSSLNYIGEGPEPNYQEYRLTITDNNSFELQVGSKISSGTAAQNGSQYQWTLSPQAGAPFTVQLSSSGIVNIGGIITFNDGNYETGPGLLTPTHSGSGVFVTLNKLNNVNLDGGVGGVPSGGISWVVTTTELILEFNRAIPGLSASDISLSGVSGVNKGILSGSNPYTLPISGFTSSGTLNMAISKSGYDIYGSPWSIYINYVYYPAVDMVQITGGSFEMGSDDDYIDQRPVHTVTLSGFSMGKYEVTQEQWTAVMGRNPSSFQGSPASGEVQNKRPVESISWYAALVFCNRLSILGGLSPAYRISGSTDPAVWGTNVNSSWDAVEIVDGSNGYRLPTEAQWEYAARDGNGSPGNYAYSGSDNADDVAWYNSNSGNKTHEAGKKAPNDLGLYDMSGNVWEWCWDWYDQDYYSSSPSNNPTGPIYGDQRVLRGGSWNGEATYLPYRYYYKPRNSYNFGLRIVCP